MNINSLPDGALCCVASFLHVIEKSFFARAISETSAGADSLAEIETTPLSQVLITHDAQIYEQLDFGEIGASLASRLNDDDLNYILQSVNAVDNLKRLVLTNCFAITGRGLECLCESTVLQFLDLSLVGLDDDPQLAIVPMISEADVFPILDRLIEVRENSAKIHIQYPANWNQETSELFTTFEERYDRFMIGNQRGPNCQGESTSFMCCNQCIKTTVFCDFFVCCEESNIKWCESCHRSFCSDCVRCNECEMCGCCAICTRCSYECKGCAKWYCSECHQTFCRSGDVDCQGTPHSILYERRNCSLDWVHDTGSGG
jgi:hypothetical protein